MSSLYITHYYVKGTDPWKNIMLLPEEAAFQKAAELASAHKGMTSYGRFADFINYYPLRKAADKLLREQFAGLGGKYGSSLSVWAESPGWSILTVSSWGKAIT